MKLARYGLAVEGWVVLLLAAAVAAWLLISPRPVFAIIPAFVVMFAILKFRDPEREVPADPLGVISPVDGRVTRIEREADAVRIDIRIAAFTPYILRSPTEGKVLDAGQERGGHGMRIRTDEDEEVFLRLHSLPGLPPASVVDYGERVGQGQAYGVLRGACRAQLWLPSDAEILVQRGDDVAAGETVLGRFHRNGTPARP